MAKSFFGWGEGKEVVSCCMRFGQCGGRVTAAGQPPFPVGCSCTESQGAGNCVSVFQKPGSASEDRERPNSSAVLRNLRFKKKVGKGICLLCAERRAVVLS